MILRCSRQERSLSQTLLIFVENNAVPTSVNTGKNCDVPMRQDGYCFSFLLFRSTHSLIIPANYNSLFIVDVTPESRPPEFVQHWKAASKLIEIYLLSYPPQLFKNPKNDGLLTLAP